MNGAILTDLPKYPNGKINMKAMVGMDIDILYYDKPYKVKILEYIKGNPAKFKTICQNIEYTVQCGSFMRCNFSGVVEYSLPSLNTFEYSEKYNCWFGYTTKGEKFAFDGDEKTIEYIKKHTWGIANNKVECGKIKKSLKQVVLGLEHTRKNSIINICNDLGLSGSYCDNRKCNLSFKEWGNINRANKQTNKYYLYKKRISEDTMYIIVEDFDGNEFIVDNNNEVLKIINKNKCRVDIMSNKKYIRCGATSLHREILGITDKKYSEWYVDHINNNGLDNRLTNLVITNHYGNMCNKQNSKGYIQTINGSYKVQFMCKYYDDNLYNNKPKVPTYKTEEEAIIEVKRRRKYVLNNRIRFKNKQELDDFIIWCNKNNIEDYNKGWEYYRDRYAEIHI